MAASGQSLPMHSAPVPNNGRYASDSDQIGEMPRTTLSAISNHGSLCEDFTECVSAGGLRRLTPQISDLIDIEGDHKEPRDQYPGAVSNPAVSHAAFACAPEISLRNSAAAGELEP